ncbi:hypothetical protein [Devosia naphthalenivorans]|uniref:hypothetical protein n=1 Tax=Devosia naphthalenivorans TaxID=2082392 RepID=UPI000D35720D|nr:hypothetical protein [Devosia naphthalenivorans]
MLIWANVRSEDEAELNDWYTRQHLFERSSIAGVLRGRRFLSDRAAIRFLVIYEAVSASVFAGEEYLRSVNNPAPRTAEVVSGFSDTVRTIHRTAQRYGDDGGCIATVRIAAGGELPAVDCKCLTLRPGMVGATVFKEDADVSGLTNTEMVLRGTEDGRCAAVIVLEGLDRVSVEREAQTLERMLAAAHLRFETGIYQHISTKYHGTDRDF